MALKDYELGTTSLFGGSAVRSTALPPNNDRVTGLRFLSIDSCPSTIAFSKKHHDLAKKNFPHFHAGNSSCYGSYV
jgi:hypothetical protein